MCTSVYSTADGSFVAVCTLASSCAIAVPASLALSCTGKIFPALVDTQCCLRLNLAGRRYQNAFSLAALFKTAVIPPRIHATHAIKFASRARH
jgi:hypothetical protein